MASSSLVEKIFVNQTFFIPVIHELQIFLKLALNRAIFYGSVFPDKNQDQSPMPS